MMSPSHLDRERVQKKGNVRFRSFGLSQSLLGGKTNAGDEIDGEADFWPIK
jgi:hypothetical protein